MTSYLQKLIIGSFIGLMLFGVDAYAQLDDPLAPQQKGKPIYLGPVVGYNRSLHSAELATFEPAFCPRFQNGTANGFFVGISGEYLLGATKDSKSSIIARILYNTLPASFESQGQENEHGGFPVKAITEDGEEVLVRSNSKHVNEVIYDLISFDLQYKLNLFDTQFGVIVGPTVDMALTKDQDQTVQLLTPENASFLPDPETDFQYRDGNRTIVAKEGEIENSNAIRFGLKFGVQYEILLSGFTVIPNFNYNLGLTNLTTVDDWRVSALQLGVDVRFAL